MRKIKTAKSFSKPTPIVANTNVSRDAENDVQFELELCWCVHTLENALNSGKLSQKVAEDTAKNVKTLKSSTAPLIKKRQVMKAALGDYRTKMKEEEKKMTLAAKQIKFTTAAANLCKKSSFVKKSDFLTPGKDFRFNFSAPAADEQLLAAPLKESTTNEQANKTFISKDLNFGTGFKFNFTIDEVNDKLDFNELSIKN